MPTPATDDESGHGGGSGHGSGSSKSGGAMSAEGAMYFEISVMLIAFAALGHVLGLFDFDGGDGDEEEEGAQLRETSRTLEEETGGQSGHLLLFPSLDQRLYKELELDARLLIRRDLLLVRGGERVPCDGVVVVKDLGGAQQRPRKSGGQISSSSSSSSSYYYYYYYFVCVDESVLTGESFSVAKATGDQMLDGTVSVVCRREFGGDVPVPCWCCVGLDCGVLCRLFRGDLPLWVRWRRAVVDCGFLYRRFGGRVAPS